jgi:hypothetical protein
MTTRKVQLALGESNAADTNADEGLKLAEGQHELNRGVLKDEKVPLEGVVTALLPLMRMRRGGILIVPS